ncbi:MAG: helicase-related protein, partial [Eubacteriales bacterium]|nr:helicase-related protein [Eubacteriales bacterium]
LQEFFERQPGSGIIYAATRKESESVAAWLRDSLGISAGCYHAGLTPNQRTAVQEAFIKEAVRVVVATNAFGMGIDKPNIRFVIHYSLPASLEAYYQEIGRAGRDGLPSDCRLLFSLKDSRLQEWMIEHDKITRDDLTLFWRICAKYADGGKSVVPIVELERAGLGTTKQRLVVSMLERLQAIRSSDRDEEYRYLEPGRRPPPEAVQAALREVENRLAYRKQKLNTVVNWANTTLCRRTMLLEYFGEKPEGSAKRCCDNCLATASGDLEFSRDPLVVLACVVGLPRGVGRKKLADILRGAPSPNMTAYGYDTLVHYRALAGRSGKEILEMIDRLLADGYLATEGSDYPVVALTPQGKAALKKGDPVPVPVKWNKAIKRSADRSERTDANQTETAPDENLLVALKEYRTSLVKQEKKPAYVYFHDSVLKEIARVRPRTLAELRAIKGLGESKVSAHGQQILSIIKSC